MRGMVIINGYPSAEKFYRQGEKIRQAIEAAGVACDLIKNGDVYAWLSETGEAKASFAQEYDFAVYLDKDKYLGQLLECAGMRLFNSARAVELCDDKLLTYIALRDSGLRLASVIPAPLCYTKGATPNEAFLSATAEKLGLHLAQAFNSYTVCPNCEKLRKNGCMNPIFTSNIFPIATGVIFV